MNLKYDRKIKNFHIDGVAKDQETIIRLRGELEGRIIEDMRNLGYVPSLDITPEMFWVYQKDEDPPNFKYVIIVYGAYVGKKKSKEILGLLGPHPIYVEPHED